MNQPDSRRWVAHGVPVGAAPAPTPSRLRRRLGPLGLVGGLLLLAGLGLGGYVLWQMHGTNIVSERAHRELVLEAEAHWDRQTAIDRTSEQGRGSFTSRYGPVEAVIRIPRFGDDYAVSVLAGTSEHVLSVGYGHFAGTAEAGAVGNYALAAHRVTHGEPLRRMPELEVGDEMVVETARWIYTYRLDTAGDALSVPFTQGWVVGEVPDNPRTGGIEPAQEPGQRLITLTTCAELFQTDDRLIAFGRMVGKQPGH